MQNVLRRVLRPVLGVLAVGLLANGVTWAAPAGVEVEAVVVGTQALTQSVRAVGTLNSQDAVILRPEISGRIAAINFEEGGEVHAGDVLLELDAAIARAELEQAQAAMDLAQSQFNRAQQLTQKGFISQQARDESGSELKVKQAAVSLAQAQLDKTRIKAPFDGLIGLRQVSLGDYVSPGQDLAPLQSIDPLNVDFRIPEQFLGQVRVGAPIVLSFDSMPGVTKEGMVDAISPLIEVGGRSILLRAKVPNDDRLLRPGMFARVQLQFTEKRALVVPEAAIAPSGDGNAIYVVEAGKARRVEVILGLRQQSMVEVVGEVEEGDHVIVAGLQKVFDGTPVDVLLRTSEEADQSED